MIAIAYSSDVPPASELPSSQISHAVLGFGQAWFMPSFMAYMSHIKQKAAAGAGALIMALNFCASGGLISAAVVAVNDIGIARLFVIVACINIGASAVAAGFLRWGSSRQRGTFYLTTADRKAGFGDEEAVVGELPGGARASASASGGGAGKAAASSHGGNSTSRHSTGAARISIDGVIRSPQPPAEVQREAGGEATGQAPSKEGADTTSASADKPTANGQESQQAEGGGGGGDGAAAAAAAESAAATIER